MTLNLPNGSNTSAVTDPDGRSIGEIIKKDTGETVWTSFTNYAMDMVGTSDTLDLSSHSVTVPDGWTFLTWIRLDQLGSSGGAHYPGIFANASGGGWDDYASMSSTDGNAYTSGTPDAHLRLEMADGSVIRNNAVPLAVGDGTWHLVGFSPQSDGSINWFINDQTPGDDYNGYGGGSNMTLNWFGPGYAGADNTGIGGKYLDEPALWDRTLTASEVADYYNNGTLPDSPVNHWRFNDNSDGTTALDDVGSADATINNATYIEGGPSVIGGSGGDSGGGSGDAMYLDMTDTSAHIDLSSHSIQVNPGESFLMWTKMFQVGSADNPQYPGIAANGLSGGWDNFISFRNDDASGAQTSGTVNTQIVSEAADGSWVASDAVSYDLDTNPWVLVGFTYHSDYTLTFWFDGQSVTTRTDDLTASSPYDLAYLGVGYAGATNDGMGNKHVDAPGKWNRELTASEVSAWADNGTIPDSPAHLWLLDDDSDTSTALDDAGSADGSINASTYLAGGPTSSSSDTGVVEDFGSGDFTNWSTSENFQITQSPTYTGSYAASVAEGEGEESLSDSESDGNLGRYQHIGDNVRAFFYHPQAMSNITDTCRVRWGYGGPWGSNYVVNVDFANDNIRIWKNGYGTSFAGVTQVSYPGGEWWAIESEWGDPTHTARVVDYSDPQNPVVDAEISGDDTEIDDTSVAHQWTGWNNTGTGGAITLDHLEFY